MFSQAFGCQTAALIINTFKIKYIYFHFTIHPLKAALKMCHHTFVSFFFVIYFQ